VKHHHVFLHTEQESIAGKMVLCRDDALWSIRCREGQMGP
jgi:hypothetical protein